MEFFVLPIILFTLLAVRLSYMSSQKEALKEAEEAEERRHKETIEAIKENS